MFFKNLINIFKKRKTTNNISESQNIIPNLNNNIEKTIPENKEIQIEVATIGNFTKVNIKETCSISEYTEAINRLGIGQVCDKIVNQTIWNSRFQLVEAKEIYVFSFENISYNIYTKYNKIYINEMIKYENNDKDYLDERIIKIYKDTNDYIITRLKHDKTLSTHYVKSFVSKDPNRAHFSISKSEGLTIAKDILNNLSKIPNIQTILDFETIDLVLDLDDELEKQIQIKGSQKAK